MDIGPYEEWMRPRVAGLFHRQYGVQFLDRFDRFYEHPYQRDRCIRVAAVDGDDVVGFAGFCFWPYVFDGRRLDSFQACDGLVDARHRGHGVYRRMTQWASEQRDADFFTGFPVRASREAFVRGGWENILDLRWCVKLRNPFTPEQTFSTTRPPIDPPPATPKFRLSTEPDFLAWRDHYAGPREYFASRGVVFELKRSRRKRLLRELIVGDVHAGEGADLRGAFDDLARAARRVSFVSFASNEWLPFRKIDRTISFIVKPLSTYLLVTDPTKWTLYRSDIDTW